MDDLIQFQGVVVIEVCQNNSNRFRSVPPADDIAFGRCDRPVGFDVEHEFVEVGHLADLGSLNAVRDLAYRREDRVDRDDHRSRLPALFLLGAAVPDPTLRLVSLDLELGGRGEGGEVEILVDDLHSCRGP